MKRSIMAQSLKVLVLFFYLTACIMVSNAQTYYNMVQMISSGTTTSRSDLFSSESSGVITFGVKLNSQFYSPAAKFHIKDVCSQRPVFLSEATDAGTVMHFYRTGGLVYGIYQTGPTDGTGFNYFQNPIGIGCTPVAGYGIIANGSASFSGGMYLGAGGEGAPPTYIHSRTPTMRLIIDPPALDKALGAKECITMNNSGTTGFVTVRDNLSVVGNTNTQSFTMLTNAGNNKVLMSDEFGNGTWRDILQSGDNDWIRTPNNDLVSNCRNVGVGNDAPEDKFQVNSGASKLTIGSAVGEALYWGTSYVGFNASRQRDRWIVSSDGAHNGGAAIYSDIFGDTYFINMKTMESSKEPQYFSDDEMVKMTTMTILKDGNVGIGTRAPGVALDVNRRGETTIRSFALGSYTSSLWAMNFQGGYGLTVDENGMGHLSENAWSPKPLMSFKNGRIGIGCEDFGNVPNDHKLFVAGGITAEDIEVKLHGDWWDNVFTDTYHLRPLGELETYIKTNQHLPDIPSESEVRETGINLGEMNALLLKKVEELTLYVINQQKQISELKEQLDTLKK